MSSGERGLVLVRLDHIASRVVNADHSVMSGCRISRSRLRCWRVLTCPVESKPNSRMIKTNTIGIMLMVSSIIDEESPR